MYSGRSRRVRVLMAVSTISLSATASPTSSAVFDAYESWRSRPMAYNDTGIATSPADVAVELNTELKP